MARTADKTPKPPSIRTPKEKLALETLLELTQLLTDSRPLERTPSECHAANANGKSAASIAPCVKPVFPSGVWGSHAGNAVEA